MRSKKAIYNVSTNLLLQLVTILYGFIIPKIIISRFGSNVNGLVSSITQFLAYITLLEAGFGPVVKAVLYKPIAGKDKKTIANILKTTERFFRTISYIFIAYIICLSLLYPLIINSAFNYLYTVSLIVIISISIFAEYYFGMTYRLYLQAEQKTYIISLIQVVTYILSLLVILVLVKFNASIHIIKLVSGLVFIIRPIYQNIYVKRKYNIDLKNANKDFNIKQKWDGLAQHIAAVIHSNTDITVLTIFSNLYEVSVYAVYHLVVNGIKKIIQSFTIGIDAIFGDMLVKNEKSNLNKKFSAYEFVYFSITTIVFTSTIILIVPFILVYTSGIKDVNYIRPLFGVLIVISEYIWAIRSPYSSITLAAGHFKETRIGAWVECITNIVVSIILVNKYGIVGVAIGTIAAMVIRTIEFVYHANKYVLERSIFESVKKILLVIIETILIVFTCNCLQFIENTGYISWIVNAIIVFIIASIITLSINCIFYRKEFNEVKILIRRVFNKKERINNEIN